MGKVVLSSGVQGVNFRVYQNQDKKSLKRVAWGLDVGQEDRTRIKSLVFVFAYFLRFIFFLASYFITLSVVLTLVFRSYIWYQSPAYLVNTLQGWQ